jgi:hypothetical protein
MQKSKQTKRRWREVTRITQQRALRLWTNNINKFRLMSINVIERNGSTCKYVEIFTHRVGSIGAPSRRTVFIRGTTTKQWEVSKIAGRNTKANILQKGSTAFKATIDLNKKKLLRDDVSIYLMIVDLISPRHQYKYMEHKGKKR